MVLYHALLCPSAVLRRRGRGKVPFDEAGARHERDIVEVVHAECEFEFGLSRRQEWWSTSNEAYLPFWSSALSETAISYGDAHRDLVLTDRMTAC